MLGKITNGEEGNNTNSLEYTLVPMRQLYQESPRALPELLYVYTCQLWFGVSFFFLLPLSGLEYYVGMFSFCLFRSDEYMGVCWAHMDVRVQILNTEFCDIG